MLDSRFVVEARRADPRRRFLVQAHVGNYSLYLTGLFGRWLDHYRSALGELSDRYLARA